MNQKLQEALAYDDRREDAGMHPEERTTCHQCQSWANHAHHPITNRRITWAQYGALTSTRGGQR
jgi:hypothetical protein